MYIISPTNGFQEIRLQLNIDLSLLFKNSVLLLPTLPERIRRPQSVLHELHVCHLTILHTAPDQGGVDARLPQYSRAIREAAEHGDILIRSEERLDFEWSVGPDIVHGCEGIDDGLRPGCNGILVSGCCWMYVILEIWWKAESVA